MLEVSTDGVYPNHLQVCPNVVPRGAGDRRKTPEAQQAQGCTAPSGVSCDGQAGPTLREAGDAVKDWDKLDADIRAGRPIMSPPGDKFEMKGKWTPACALPWQPRQHNTTIGYFGCCLLGHWYGERG